MESGEGANSHPCNATLGLDIRLQPHLAPDAILDQLRRALSTCGAELIVDYIDPAAEAQSEEVYGVLADAVMNTYTDAVPIPVLSAGASDARFISTGGIDCFGFPPLDLRELDCAQLAHAVDERMPLRALERATACAQRALETLCWK